MTRVLWRIEKKWYVVNAENKVLGRLASEIANRLRGKHKPTFSNFIDNGDFIVVTNAEKIALTGNKLADKKYYRHSRFFGSLKEMTAAQAKEKDSTFIIHEAVRGMLPTNKLSRHVIMKLKTYTGAEHPHAAQKPELFTLPTKK